MTRLERCLGYSGGLAMVGIKASSLICLKHKDYVDLYSEIMDLSQKMMQIGVSLEIISDNNERMLIMVYRRAILERSLSRTKTKKFLTKYGYKSMSASEEKVEYLKQRFAGGMEFPHEIGAFLGYPIEDIEGFIANPSGYKLCGAWKVYHNVDECREIFKTYKNCTTTIANKMQSGEDLVTIFAQTI